MASLPARSLLMDASGSRETATAGSSGTALSISLKSYNSANKRSGRAVKIVGADSATVRRYSNNHVTPTARSSTCSTESCKNRELAACNTLALEQQGLELLPEHKTATVNVHLTAWIDNARWPRTRRRHRPTTARKLQQP